MSFAWRFINSRIAFGEIPVFYAVPPSTGGTRLEEVMVLPNDTGGRVFNGGVGDIGGILG